MSVTEVKEYSWMFLAAIVLLQASATICENCPTEHENEGKHSLHRQRPLHDSLEFLIKLTNATGCLGMAAKLRVFYMGNNFTVINWYKVRLSANRSVPEHETIVTGRGKFHMISAEAKEEDDYYLFICNLTFEDSGEYIIELKNNVGSVSRSTFVSVFDCGNNEVTSKTPAGHLPTWIYVLCGLLPMCLFSLFGLFCIKRRMRKRRSRRQDVVHENPIYNQIPPADPIPIILPAFGPELEIAQQNLLLEHLLGEGAFGKVYRGSFICDDRSYVVAIKMLKGWSW